MDEDIKVDDFLSQELETEYMQVLVDLVSGKIQSIGPTESEALVALRKEFYRRNIGISSLIKELHREDAKVKKLEKENDSLTTTIIQQYEYNQSLLKNVNTLQRQAWEAEDGLTIAEMKLSHQGMIQDFGEANEQLASLAAEDDSIHMAHYKSQNLKPS